MKKNILILLCLCGQTFAATEQLPLKKSKSAKSAKTAKAKKTTSAESVETVSHLKSIFLTLNNTNQLGDLQYMPKQNELIGSAELSIKPSTVTANYKGKDVFTVNENFTTQMYKLNYGVLEKLSAGISIEHYLSGKRETEVVEQKKTISAKSSGFADPVINGTYRLTNQRVDKVNTDVTLLFSPSLVKAEDGSEDKKGTRGRGAYFTQAKIEVGAKLPQISVSGNFAVGVEGEKEIKDIASGEKYKVDSNTMISLGGEVRKELTDTFALKGGLGLTFVGEEKRKSAGTSFYTMDSFTRIGFSGEAQYTIIPQKVLAKLKILVNNDGSRSLKLGDNKLDVDSSGNQVYLLGADYLF